MSHADPGKLTPELAAMQVEIEQHARKYGLDFYPTIFELIDADQLNAIAARGGFPTRYPHWRFGMEYEQLSTGYQYGLQKIYEMVINNDPCYAYLMVSNPLVDQKMVMAHVYGHCDFFKNNQWFSQTDRHMIDEIANHGNRIRRYMDRFGVDDVECFIDVCLSIEDLIDIHSPFVKRHDDVPRYEFPEHADDEPESTPPTRFRSKGYMDRFINPPEALAAEVRQNVEKQRKREQRFPSEPVRDVMLFFLEHAPLKSWQRDILSIIRDEAYYFAPQAQTKIMNEGWATYWHSTIMTRHGIEPADLICYADHCSGTLASSQTKLNPYKLGLELFRHVEQRWNKGQFGEAWEQCDDMRQKHDWDTKTMLGREKIFGVRRIHNDLTFIDEFLTLDFCREHKLFSFGFNQHSGFYEIESRQFAEIKQRLLFNLTNVGRPIIRVIDANHMNRGELFLQHRYSGVELKASYAADTLANVYRLWNRPVHIETVLDDKATILSFDGAEHTSTETDELIEIGD